MTPEQWVEWRETVKNAKATSLIGDSFLFIVTSALILAIDEELCRSGKLALRPWEWTSSKRIHGYAVQTDSLVDLGIIPCDGTVLGCPGDWVEGWPDGTIRTRHEGDRRASGRVLKTKDEPDSTFSPG